MLKRAWLLAAVLMAPWGASAQTTRADYLRQFDADRDGKVNMTEYVIRMSQGFRRMDANGDGVLQSAELPGNRGGPLTLQARQADLRRQFRKLDRNRDGFLSAHELTAPP